MWSVFPLRYLGLGHIALKSPRSASAAPGQGNHSEFLPGRFPAPPQRPCQGGGHELLLPDPLRGPLRRVPSRSWLLPLFLLQVLPAWLLTPFGVIFFFFFRNSGALLPSRGWHLAGGALFLWTPRAENCLPLLTSLFPTVFKKLSGHPPVCLAFHSPAAGSGKCPGALLSGLLIDLLLSRWRVFEPLSWESY